MSSKCNVMSPSTNVWKELTDLPFKIAEASSVSIGIGLMMFGGVIQENDVDALHKANCFDNSSDVSVKDGKDFEFKISRNIWRIIFSVEKDAIKLECSRLQLPFRTMGSCAVADQKSNFVFITGGRNSSS